MEKRKKKSKIPFILKVLPKVFPVYETLAPASARKFALNKFLTPFKFPMPPRENEHYDNARKNHIRYNGEKLTTFSWGDPDHPPVLIMHGWSGRATQFHKLIDKLTEHNYRVVGFDAPAHGKSKTKQTNMVEFAETLSLFMEHEDTPVAAIGHSLGGVALMYYIEKHREQFPKLVTISAPTVAGEIVRVFREKIGVSAAIHNELIEFTKTIAGKPFDYYSGISIAQRLNGQLPNHLIVHDVEDKEAPVQQAKKLHEVSKNSTLHLTEGLGHTRILRDGDTVETIVKFITG